MSKRQGHWERKCNNCISRISLLCDSRRSC